MKLWQTRGVRALLLILLVGLMLNLSRPVAHAFPVPELPADNLIVNPWFRSASNQKAPGFDGWTRPLTNGVTWGPSQKESNPSPDMVISGTCGFQEIYCGTAARWAQQSGILYPDIDVFAYQVVAADPVQRKLNFFTYYVSHRVEVGAVNIYGGSSPDGPWTLVWVPLYHSQPKQVVPESGEIRDLWEETGFIERVVEQGYPYYKVELQSRLPQNPIIRGVGFKLTGIYFSTEFTDEPGVPPPTPGLPMVTVPGQGGSTITPAATESSAETAVPTEVAPATNAAPANGETARATTVAGTEVAGDPNVLVLTAETLSPTENVLTWNISSNNGRGFRLERSFNGTSDWSPIAAVEPGITEYIDSNLRPDTLYFYRLRISQTNTSNVVSARTERLTEPEPLAETALAAPASLHALSGSPHRLTLTWEDLSTNEAGFAIERSNDGVNFTTIDITAPDTTSFAEENLDLATYFYRVRSFNGNNYSSYSDIVSVTVRGRPVESDTNEDVSQPDQSPDQEQPANNTLNGQKWLIVLVAATLFVALVSVGLLLVRTKKPPLE